MTPRMLTLAQVEEALQLSRTTVDRLLTSGQLRAVRISADARGRGSLRVRESDLEAFLVANELGAVAIRRKPVPRRRQVIGPAEPRWDLVEQRRARAKGVARGAPVHDRSASPPSTCPPVEEPSIFERRSV